MNFTLDLPSLFTLSSRKMVCLRSVGTKVTMDLIIELLRISIIKGSMMIDALGLDNLLSKLYEVPVPTFGS